jgi:hypothetical protein
VRRSGSQIALRNASYTRNIAISPVASGKSAIQQSQLLAA